MRPTARSRRFGRVIACRLRPSHFPGPSLARRVAANQRPRTAAQLKMAIAATAKNGSPVSAKLYRDCKGQQNRHSPSAPSAFKCGGLLPHPPCNPLSVLRRRSCFAIRERWRKRRWKGQKQPASSGPTRQRSTPAQNGRKSTQSKANHVSYSGPLSGRQLEANHQGSTPAAFALAEREGSQTLNGDTGCGRADHCGDQTAGDDHKTVKSQ